VTLVLRPFHEPRHNEGAHPPDLGAGERDRTADLPFTRSTATCSVRASCTNAPRHRTDSTRCAGLSRAPFHETFHAEGRQWSMTATERSDRNPSQRHLNLTTWSNRTGTPFWVHCAAELCLIWIKAAPLRSAVGPASAPGSALGGPLGARRATHRRDPQTKVAQRATTECSDEPSSPGSRLSRSRHRVNGSPTGLSHAPCSTARSRRSLSGIRALPRTRGCRPRTPRPWARPPLVFYHPAACAERAIPSMKPAWGHPPPPLQAGHLAHDDALDTTGEMCNGTPPFPPPGNYGSPPDGVKPVRARRATAGGQSAWSTYTRRQA
jgi:hypothetical protein